MNLLNHIPQYHAMDTGEEKAGKEEVEENINFVFSESMVDEYNVKKRVP